MNMNKNKKIGFFVTLLLLLGIVIFVVYKRMDNGYGYNAFMALGCAAEEYNEEAGVGYLSLVLDTPVGSVTKRIKVEDTDTKASLSAIDAKEVIGVNMWLRLPKQYISENHVDVSAIDPFDLLFSNTCDDFFSVIDVSVK